jgi:aspartate aminotransferase-like enzyme
MKLRGFVVYAGQGQLATEMFRISTMGDITDTTLERCLLPWMMCFPEAQNMTGAPRVRC